MTQAPSLHPGRVFFAGADPAALRQGRQVRLQPLRLVAAVLLVFWTYALSACATWTTSQRAMFAVNLGCNAFDGVQTSAAVSDGHQELNSVYGDHPSTGRIAGTKAVGMLLQGAALDKMVKPEDRMIPLAVMTVGCAAVVYHNYKAGARP